jgi:peptidoglycan/xylan/chitin deacetylase (PgdA/CDA1 family)
VTPLVTLLFHDVFAEAPSESGFASSAADRYKLPLSMFDGELSALCRAGACITADGVARPARSQAGGRFAITVDDGGVSYHTLVADRLEEYGWRGASFVTTDWIGRRGFLDRRQLRELADRGHLIGSHSASHPTRFSACTPAAMREEWTRSRATLEDLLGRPVRTASLPGGFLSPAVVATAADAGYTLLFTSEPVVGLARAGDCTVVGRFAIRRSSRPGLAAALVRSRWTRATAWAAWNAKALVKPVLGDAYPRVAAWVAAGR